MTEIFQLKIRVAEVYISHVLLPVYDVDPVPEKRISFAGYDDSLNYEEKVLRFKGMIEDASDVININLSKSGVIPLALAMGI